MGEQVRALRGLGVGVAEERIDPPTGYTPHEGAQHMRHQENST